MATLAVKVGVDVSGADALRNVGKDLGRLGKDLTTKLTLPIVGAGAAIFKVGADFDTAMRQITALTDVTAQEIDGIRQSVLKLAGDTGRAPQELAESFYFLASAGLDTQQALDTLDIAARASASGLGETQDVAKVLALTMNAYGAENITAAAAADTLLAAIKDGTAEADAFAGVLGRVVPTAATMGVTFDQVTAALAGMTLTGLSADEAATSLNQVLVSMLKPTKEAEKALQGMGTSSAELRKQLKEEGLLATLRDLEERFGGNEEAASQVFGNVRALRGVLSLLSLDSEQLNDIFKDTATASGALGEAFAETEGPGRDLERAIAEIQGFLIELGDTVLPIVADVLRDVAGFVRGAADAWRGLSPEVKTGIVIFAGLAAIVGPLLVIVGAMATGFATIAPLIGLLLSPVGILAGLFLILGTQTGFFADVLKQAEPVIRSVRTFIDQLVTVIGSFMSGEASFDQVVATIYVGLRDILATVGEFIGGLVQQFLAWASEVIPPLLAQLAALAGAIFAWVLEQVPVIAAQLMAWAQAFIDWIAPMIPPFLEQLGVWLLEMANWILQVGIPKVAETLGQVAEAFIAWVGPMVDKLPGVLLEFAVTVVRWLAGTAVPMLVPAMAKLASDMIVGFVNFLLQLPGRLADFLRNSLLPAIVQWGPQLIFEVGRLAANLVSALIGGLGGLARGLTDAFRGAFRGALNAIIDLWNGLKFTVPKVEAGPVSFGGFSIGTPNIPRLHSGGIVPGFAGEEVLAILEAGERVLPAGAGNGTVIVQAHIDNFYGTEDNVRRLSEELARQVRLATLAPA